MLLRVGIFNVKYSPNLGDGLLSECLETELMQAVPGLTIETFDLAGRTAYAVGGRLRGAVLGLLQKSPTLVRHGLSKTLLGRSLRRIRPAWRERLVRVDVAVTGGGNLFGDADLNFPLKIDAAWAELRAAGIPSAVFGVGVSDNWSATGEALFRRALTGTPIVSASVRDTRSAEVWNRRLGHLGVPPARVVHDPGLLVMRHVPARREDARAPLVGLGLMHPTTIRYHADERTVSERDLMQWYVALVRGCLALGWRVGVFTNGSPEDDAYLRQVRSVLGELDLTPDKLASITFAPRFHRPSELASFISGLDLLMAHRLHANIAAYSYAIPQVGFSWDSKLKNFLAQVNRDDYICTAGVHPIDAVLALAERALREGVEPRRHREVLEQAYQDVRDLASALQAAFKQGRTRSPLREPIAT